MNNGDTKELLKILAMVYVLVLLFPALIAWNFSCAMRTEKDPYNCILKLPEQDFNRGYWYDQANQEARLAFCLLSASPVTIWFSHLAECDNPNERFQARGTDLGVIPVSELV